MPDDEAPPPTALSKVERLVILGGIGIHFVLTLAVFRAAWVLVSEGSVGVFGGLFWLIGMACLYLAAAKIAWGKRHPVRSLASATACLAVASFQFGWGLPPGGVAALGALIAVIGIVAVHPLLSGRTSKSGSTPGGHR